jgi:hypothetical protein
MSGYDAKRRSAQATAPLQSGDDRAILGQSHDRIPDDVYLNGPPEPAMPGRDHNGDIEISAGQKMLSAMSGSLLTSLIGMQTATLFYSI